jgi:hypothetical protein
MKAIIVIATSLFSFSVFAQTESKCDLNAVQKELVKGLGVSPALAQSYVLAFENLFSNLSYTNVRLRESVYQGDLVAIQKDLVTNFGLNEVRADLVTSSMKMVRLVSMDAGVRLTNPACLGN